MNLDIENWKPFKVSDIFEIKHGKRLKKEDRLPGNIPFLTAGKENQGIGSYIGNENVEIYTDAISVDMFGNCFYHRGVCSGDDNIYFFINKDISEQAKLFIVGIFNKVIGDKYSYARQFRQEGADKTIIYLPSTDDKTPDYLFMEEYIKSLNIDISAIPDYFLSEGYEKAFYYLDNINEKEFEKKYAPSYNEDKLVLDIDSWGQFNLFDLFEVVLPKGDCQISKLPQGSIPLITSGKTNNGIAGYVSCGDGISELIKGNCITVDMFGNAFYRENDFYCVSHGRVNILKPKFNLNKFNGLFLLSVIENDTLLRFSFANMCTSKKIKKEIIKLPIDTRGNPDFQFMENYVKGLSFSKHLYKGITHTHTHRERELTDKIFQLLDKYHMFNTLETIKWGRFRLGDEKYFDMQRGDSSYIKNMSSGDFPYISTTTENNGISAYVSESNRDGNLITLAYDGSVGACFYQEKPFFASEKIVTIDFVKYKMTKYIAIFLIQVLKLESEMYSYGGRKWTVEQQLKNTEIQLPIDNNGEPDYDFMEWYIKARTFSSNI